MKSESYRFQRGISIPAVLGILTILTILTLAFLAMVNNTTRVTGKTKRTITAGYVAEMGFNEIRAELGSKKGDWSQLSGIVKDCATTDPFYTRCQRIPNTNSRADFRLVRENPLDSSSRVIGVYEVAVETGQKRAIFGNKTLTGSNLGYVPGSSVASEQIGYDKYGNQLCNQALAGQTCPGGYLGVKVTAWLTDSSGNVPPKTSSQSVYGVLQIDSRSNTDQGPSGYMLESNQTVQVKASTEWDPTNWVYSTMGGFYGPMHTNEHYDFEWESLDSTSGDNLVGKGPADGVDIAPPGRPFWGLLLADIGVQWNIVAPRLYTPGTDLTYFPYGKFWIVDWAPGGPEPAPGSNYTVTFRKPDMTLVSITMTKGTANSMDFPISPLNVPFEVGPIVSVNQGATTYAAGSSYTTRTDNMIDWKVVNPVTMTVINNGASETVPGNTYRARYISHSPIRVYEKMTYSNDPPVYRYWHTHAVNSGWPYYQAGHGHGNVLGADFSVNSTAAGADPGYDSTTWRHSHYITNDISVDPIPVPSGTPVPNTYLQFNAPSFKPISASRHEMPLLRPESAISNYLNQLEQLNKYLQLTLGATLPRNADGTLDGSVLANAPFNATDYNLGYIVGKFPSTMPASTPPLVDFRATYFGTDLKYSAGSGSGSPVLAAGSPIDQTAWIWVNDTAGTVDYMKVASSQINSNYRRYLYRQIPPGKIIVVRDAAVMIGNFKPQTGSCASTYHAHCLDSHAGFPADPPGTATIVDGQLSILSFTTSPPPVGQEYKYNKGDIVIVGNVLYRNDFYALPSDKTQLRQLDPQPITPYSRSRNVNPPITGISDPSVMWTTRTDGYVNRDVSGATVGNICGLGLFATYDIKISVTPLFRAGHEAPGGPDAPDSITINGQLVAGNKVWVHGDDQSSGLPFPPPDYLPDATFFSDIDMLNIYGTIYSRETPNFSEYFRVRREYFFDKSLEKNPLIGAPYYPATAGDYRTQTIFSQFPKLVQSTWMQTAN